MNINQQYQQLAHDLGADYFGVTDLTQVSAAVAEQGGKDIAQYPRAIALGIRLMDAIVDQVPRRAEYASALNYRLHAYEHVNLRLDQLASRLASALQNDGHVTLPLPAAERVNDEKICALFSHKLAAHLAGLGWIGKNCLLITPDHGPRARWTSVLTHAPLVPTGRAQNEQCGECHTCVDVCPQHAFTGKPYKEDEPREVRFAAEACDKYFRELEQQGKLKVCGVCLWVCPYGRGNTSLVK
jgi:epoxyqueuosine reductase QueG